jgi:tetratricopeptide (TPR) repeat protein
LSAPELAHLAVEVLHRWPDRWSVGSGYRIGRNLVLTASHNVGPGELLIRTKSTRDGEPDPEVPARIRLQADPDVADLALLEIRDGIEVPVCRYGSVDRTSLTWVENCAAVGFPSFKERKGANEQKPSRDSVQVEGRIPTAENLGRARLTLRVDTAPEAPTDPAKSAWSGMSGAAVFANEVVVGVVTEHHAPEGPSSLVVVPITAVDTLPDANAWWRLLRTKPFELLSLPVAPWEAAVREEGAIVWTHADFEVGLSTVEDRSGIAPLERGEPVDVALLRQGRLPNLQLDFENLAEAFDGWVAPGPQRKRGGAHVRVLWLEHDAGAYRSKALLACLSRGEMNGRRVCDAGMNLGRAATALKAMSATTISSLSPLISVDLEYDQTTDAWKAVREAVDRVRSHILPGLDPYPRLVVAGAAGQAQTAAKILEGRVELSAIDTRGRPRRGEVSVLDPGRRITDVYIKGLPSTTPELVGRSSDLDVLRQAWSSERTRIVSVVAYGGTGKSALVNTWLGEMREHHYRQAQRVFAWSFYSQGTKENLVSADLFVGEALGWLGDVDVATLSPTNKGVRLASLIKEHSKEDRFLMVLDGVEPLQHPLSDRDVGGRLTDDSIRVLLEELAKPDWAGLCVVTTRVPLTDLTRFEDDRSGDGPTVTHLDLRNLDDDAGAALLRRILQREYEFDELQPAVREVGGHALAITLLGNYLRDAHDGDLAGRFDLERLSVEVNEGGHARRIMESYVRWLDEHGRSDELAILLVIGLFDRPAEPNAMRSLLADTNLRPFMSHIDRIGSDVWDRCIDALRRMGLLSAEIPDWPDALDAHPLVREHFRDKLLSEDRRDMWMEGNRTLFAHYRDTALAEPDDVKGMSRLYAAVTHGCAADLHQQAFDDVLLARIWHDKRTNYSTRHLGMTGADLVALSNYFRSRWRTLKDRPLTASARILILTNAGVRLRQLGRLADARECFGAVVAEINQATASADDLEDAAYAAAQFCELLVIAGRLTGSNGALQSGERAIAYSDGGRDAYFRMHARSSLAEVHYMLGDLDRAREYFGAAMAIDAVHHPRPPFLYSQSLFRYGYYLIETERAQQVIEGAEADSNWGTNGGDTSLLSRAIRLLVLGAAHRALVEGGERNPDLVERAEGILSDAIIAFRSAGYSDYLVRGLIERARFYRVRQDLQGYDMALADLERATFETDRGDMDLLVADILLQRAACYMERIMTNVERPGDRDELHATLDGAKDLVKQMGYGRRQMELGRLRRGAAALDIGSDE